MALASSFHLAVFREPFWGYVVFQRPCLAFPLAPYLSIFNSLSPTSVSLFGHRLPRARSISTVDFRPTSHRRRPELPVSGGPTQRTSQFAKPSCHHGSWRSSRRSVQPSWARRRRRTTGGSTTEPSARGMATSLLQCRLSPGCSHHLRRGTIHGTWNVSRAATRNEQRCLAAYTGSFVRRY